MARRSTRLSSRNSSTPKRVSLSHDAPTRTPKTAPVKLGALAESDEMPGAFPQSASPPDRSTPSAAPKQGVKVPVHFNDSTPKQATPLKPSSDEMHPAQHHQSTAKPLDEARWLGFASMPPHTEPSKYSSKIATLQGTPSKTQQSVTAPQYQFTFQREHSLELSPEAKRLMFEKREEAARIREQMVAEGEVREDVDVAVARKIATPKGKSGRFSQAHLDQFQKMDSIAGHASAFRAQPSFKKPATTQAEAYGRIPQSATKSLKRSPSKAQLDEPDQKPAHALPRNPSKPTLISGSSLPRAASSKNMHIREGTQDSSPAKRVKRFQGDDATITRPSSSGSDARQPGTPSPVKHKVTYPDLTSLASPTQASLARTESIKSTKTSKIPGPALARSPSKANLTEDSHRSTGPSTPLLARSPSKVCSIARFADAGVRAETPSKTMSPLLARSPVKGSPFKKQDDAAESSSGKTQELLLSRSPMKMSVTKDAGALDSADAPMQTSSKEPLLSRSPLKISVTKHADADGEANQARAHCPGKTSLFARSPMKMSVTKFPEGDSNPHQPTTSAVHFASVSQASNPTTSAAHASVAGTPTKSANKNLLDRFSFLRTSPVKSILRSPQRLYSDDPAKVAAGTHLATPPKKSATELNKRLVAAAKTAPNRKQVDFTSSTKARYERAQSEVASTPSKESTPNAGEARERQMASTAASVQYPSLPAEDLDMAITPQNRRQTIAPGDFTFRAGPEGIIFGTSPNAPASMNGKKRASTIRHVSAEPTLPATTTKKRKFEFENDKATHEDNSVPAPATTSKKRKFEFENEQVAESEAAGTMSDKENAGEEVADEHPAKRVKQSAPSPEKKARRPTLGVRPKGEVKGARSASGGQKPTTSTAKSAGTAKDKKPATISQARLAALAQPKRRI